MDPLEKEAFVEGLEAMIATVPAAELAGAFEEFGWLDMLSEAPDDAVEITFPLAGKHLISLPLLDDVLVQAAGLEPESSTAVIYPKLSVPKPSSLATSAGENFVVQIKGTVAARTTPPEVVVTPVLLEGSPALLTGPWGQDWPAQAGGMDPNGGWASLETEWTVTSDGLLSQDPDAWSKFQSTAHHALALYMVSVGSAMLDLAVDHTTSREQFGQAISTFQVVRHKLADVRILQETATLAAEAASESDDPMTAMLAKILAGRFLETARLNCQQLLGGMGFTTEHAFHTYLRRALVLEKLFGSTQNLRSELGQSLSDAETIPRLISL
jgi:hypothetical protein